MPLREYQDKRTRHNNPFATIQPTNGNFVFNKKALPLLPDGDHVLYLTDVEEELVALKQSNPEEPNSYKITRGDYSAQISASGVLKEFGYYLSEWESKHACPVSRRDDLVVIDLSDIDE